MSARGARSRKAVAKDIEKKEKKIAVKNKAIDTIRRPHDAFATYGPSPSVSSRDTGVPTRSYTVSSDASRATSRGSSTNLQSHSSRPQLNTINSSESLEIRGLRPQRTSGSTNASISEGSTTGKEKTKYQAAPGKGSKAPRGRGGGVPVKKTVGTAPNPPLFRSESVASNVPLNQKTWINFRIWEGGESGLPPYGGFDYDEHMQSGNVLIYFKEEQASEDRPMPQLRCDLEVLENAGSTWLSNALLYGRIDDNEDEWTLPGSPESSVPSHALSPNFPPSNSQRRMLSPTSPGGRSPPPFNIDQAYFGVPGHGTSSRAQHYPDTDRMGGASSPPPFQRNSEIQPTHELWFTAPAHIWTPQGQRLHHVAVRNFLAMLHNKPIVGADLYEMLSTLQPEIQVMYDLDNDSQTRTARERSVQMIISYLSQHKIDDLRNSIKSALGLLAWAEQDNVKWRQGYLESFVHLAGVMSPQLEDLPDFKRLSIITRRNLDIAGKALQLRTMEAEEKLSSFDFNELWGEEIKGAGPIYQSYTAFRQFLIGHYTKIYGNWPLSQSRSWLNRKIVLALQQDFGALYDFLVNRDVVWDSREERPGKKWEMINTRSEEFRADTPELGMTDMLVTFDNRHGYLHIPHPYPLLPRELPQTKAPEKKKKLFSSLKKSKTDATKDAKAHLQLSIVFSDATNIEKTDVSFNGSTLIDQFERFELSADLKGVTPREARLGRWVLLYGILQTLSRLSVDVRDLKWTEGVRYFLCTDLERCPDWVTNGQVEYLEASQLRSYCWQRPWGPSYNSGEPVELEATSIPVGGELEGGAMMSNGATMLNNEIYRLSEKLDGMSAGHRREFERGLENEKVKREEFNLGKRTDNSYRLTESDFTFRPTVPSRHPLRNARDMQHQPQRLREHSSQSTPSVWTSISGPRGGYCPDEKNGWM